MPIASVNGVGLYYEESGLGDRTPFVFTGHGRKWWLWQWAYFSEHYRVLTHDRRGTGFSDDPPGDWSVKDFSEDLLGILDHIGVEKAIVAGHSLGAAVACVFGLDHPHRVHALILSGQVYYWDELDNEWVDEMLAGKADLRYQPRSFKWEERGPPTTHPELGSSTIGAYFLKVMSETGKVRSPEQRALNNDRMLRSLRGWDMRPRSDELTKLGARIPVLIMIGGFESQSAIPRAYEWHKAISGSEFVINQGCYHACPRENPGLWNERVKGFLERHGL